MVAAVPELICCWKLVRLLVIVTCILFSLLELCSVLRRTIVAGAVQIWYYLVELSELVFLVVCPCAPVCIPYIGVFCLDLVPLVYLHIWFRPRLFCRS